MARSAFSFYSLALQRGSVTGATAPLIVIQTVTPALIGLVVLDDQVREGWGWVAFSASLSVVAGAVALARFEAGPGHVPETGTAHHHDQPAPLEDDQPQGPLATLASTREGGPQSGRPPLVGASRYFLTTMIVAVS